VDDQYVDVYIDSRPRAYTYLRSGSLAEEIKLNREPSGSRPDPRTCAHDAQQEVFAYARELEVHWPIVICDGCLAILEGRKPFAFRDALEGAAAVTLEDLIARKWAKDWPRDGKPQTKRPPAGTTWPKTA
jgi:hypothetical protein